MLYENHGSMKITEIECIPLLIPDYDAEACSSAQDNLVVKIRTDEGLIGIGETDANPWAVKAMIEAPGTHCMGLGLKETLIGTDPLDVEGLWQRLYQGSAMNGRRGLGIHAGHIASTGCLLPVTEALSAAGGSAAFFGPSAKSYRYRGTDWGLPIDVACQVAAYRPDLLARLDASVPQTWEEVRALGRRCAAHNQSIVIALRGVHSLMTFFSLCANLGHPFASEAGESRIDTAAACEALAQMRRLVELCRAPVLDFNSIDVQEALSASDELVYCPGVYGFAAYGEADRERRLAFGPFPGAALPRADAGSTIGGAGLGISARVADDPEKADAAFAYLRFAARAASQKDVFARHHGQPAHVDVWNDPGIDARFGGFFSATRGTIERSWVRPRYDGYLSFQTRAGNLIEAHLRDKLSEHRLLDSLKTLDAECRPAISR